MKSSTQIKEPENRINVSLEAKEKVGIILEMCPDATLEEVYQFALNHARGDISDSLSGQIALLRIRALADHENMRDTNTALSGIIENLERIAV